MSNCSLEMHTDSASSRDTSANTHPLTSTICWSYGGGERGGEWKGGRERGKEGRGGRGEGRGREGSKIKGGGKRKRERKWRAVEVTLEVCALAADVNSYGSANSMESTSDSKIVPKMMLKRASSTCLGPKRLARLSFTHAFPPVDSRRVFLLKTEWKRRQLGLGPRGHSFTTSHCLCCVLCVVQ